MNTLNSILVEGNIVRDPVVKETPKGTKVCTFSLASNRYYKINDGYEQETSFFDVESWGQEAERCMTECIRGRGIRVVGRLKQDRWVGAEGKNYSRVKIVADHIEYKPKLTKTKEKEQEKPAEMETAEKEALVF